MKVWERVACRRCKAEIGERCKTLTTEKTTDTHKVRLEDAHGILRAV